MITKQQALEFIYDLSQKYETTINSHLGIMSVKGFNSEDIEYETPAINKGLEGAVQEFIREYPHIAKEVSNKIPVDVDMLEAGQTYKIIFNEAQITDELANIDDNNIYFRRHYPIKIQSIREIYKVNE